jgi:ribosome-associated protein
MSDPVFRKPEDSFGRASTGSHPVRIPDSEIGFEAVHASGPGGQNINKVATAIRLTFDPSNSSILDGPTRERLIMLAGSHASLNGVITILARRFRSQEMNRQDALNRLKRLIEQAMIIPSHRYPTRPTRSSQLRRLMKKINRKKTKELRRKGIHED